MSEHERRDAADGPATSPASATPVPPEAGGDAVPGRHPTSPAVVGLFALALLAACYLARALLVPIALAFLLFFPLRPLVRTLRRIKLPSSIAAVLALLLVLGPTMAATVALFEPASTWFERLPRSLQTLERRLRPLREPVKDVKAVAERMERIANVDRPNAREVKLQQPSLLDAVVAQAGSVIGGMVVMFLTLFFLLMAGDGFMQRMLRLLPGLHDPTRAASVLKHIEWRMTAYLLTIIAINATLGTTIGVTMALLGVPNPSLWAVLAAVLNFVPYVGSIVGIGTLAMVAIVSFDTLSQALIPPLAYFVLTTLEGNIITPMLLGRQFRIDPIVLFLWLVTWTWLWGIPGAMMAVPMLTFCMILSEQVESLQPVARFIRP